MKLDHRSGLERLSEAQHDQLSRFEWLLRTKGLPLGLVSQGDATRLWERHIVDSLRALSCLPKAPAKILDVGSGAGLPGIPVAIARGDCSIFLIEPRARRAAFLELVKEALALPNVYVENARAGDSVCRGNVAMARALAEPARSWRLCHRLLLPSGWMVYFAGRSSTFTVGRYPGPGADEAGEGGPGWEICAPALFPSQGPVVKIFEAEPSVPID